MQVSLNLNTINNLNSGALIYKQGARVETVSFVLKGRVLVYNQGIRTIMGAGSFIGINDIFEGTYICNYVASEPVTIYTFEVHNSEGIRKIMNANSDYNGLMTYHLNMYISELGELVRTMRARGDELFEFLDITFVENQELISNHNIHRYESDVLFDADDIDYYDEASKLSIDIQKSYFGSNQNLTLLHITRQARLINILVHECLKISKYTREIMGIIYDDKKDCIFNSIAKEGLNSKSAGNIHTIIEMLDRVIDEIRKTEKLFEEKTGTPLSINMDRIEELFVSVTSADNNNEVSTDIQMKFSGSMASDAITAMEGSVNQILEYAELEEFRKEEIRLYLSDFRNMKDKSAISESSRILRKNITDAYYELYTKIFLKAYNDRDLNRVIELFLNYGYMDETLLTNDQCIELYYLEDENNKEGKSNVYTIWQWLKAIYSGRKEPSKNEFDLEYAENLRDIKKSRKVTAEEEKDYLTNPLRKVEYEIKNMFKYNNRVVSGQISVFIPVLHKEAINKSFAKMFVTTNKANSDIDRITAIDYSAYAREVLFYDESKGIQKEYIIKQAYPDIIMMPTVGGNSVMWQEIEARKRNTSARFIIPVFCDSDLFEQFVKLTGRFRFELCRTIEGISWNNIQEKSLTSEYADYIQFYTKNRDMSEEQKQKLKQQIQRGRNNLREIFTLDYMVWIQNESQGYMRLSKPSRIIMATYCPFVKSIREYNVKQPIFKEAMGRYLKEKQKKARDFTMLVNRLQKEKIEVPEEIEETRIFYCDL